MTFKVILVEDVARDRTRLPERIRELGEGQFDVLALPPPANMKLAEVSAEDGDLFLVDYELDTMQPDGSVAPYSGASFAARLREKEPEHAIVLLTRSDLAKWTAVRRMVLTGAAFDDIMYKDSGLESDPDTSRARLVSLARGYRTLRGCKIRCTSTLLALLQTDNHGCELAREALAPSDGWSAFEGAHWIRSVLLRYPGVLYDEAHAAVALGISGESFQLGPMQELVLPAMYRGPFTEEQPRWWKHILLDIANEVCIDADIKLGLREGFRLAVDKRFRFKLEASKDVESGICPADTVCYLLRVPVRVETSLPYHPDARPSVMEKSRISFRAVRDSNDVEETYVEPGSRARIDDIRAAY